MEKKNKKGILFAILGVIGVALIVVLIFLLRSCGEEEISEDASGDESVPEIHIHIYSESYESNETAHWYVCECGEVNEMEFHNYGDWTTVTAATCTSNGNKKRTCQTCGYSETQTIVIDGHKYEDGICIHCEDLQTKGLKYNLLNDGTYEVSGIGNCKDIDIHIPRKYNGKAVSKIGYLAFYNCNAVENITIPDSVTCIDMQAFWGCVSLTSIHIPSSVSIIGVTPFVYCTNLNSITVDSNNSVYHSVNNCLIETATKTLIRGCENSIIPNSVTQIAESAFHGCKNLKSITIPSSVTHIGSDAFGVCSALTNINIPNSVSYIGTWAFAYCSSLTSINIPDSVTRIDDRAFDGCVSLTSIYIPSSVSIIGEAPFAGCSNLNSITVDSNNSVYHSVNNCLIETATKTLIQGCKNSIIPNSVTCIGDSSFSRHSLKQLTIPDSVTYIGEAAFYRCESLTSITIPASVTTIDYYAFYGCDSLVSVTFKDTANWYIEDRWGNVVESSVNMNNSSTNADYLRDSNFENIFKKRT